MFITFEGIEGCGKTTQARLLYDWLKSNGKETLLTREPGGTESAEEIRKFLLKDREEFFPPFSEVCLYMAARSFHVENLIRPSLESGKWIICDRFADSTIAYQGFGRGIELDLLKFLNDKATRGVEPDITFLIDVPVEIGLSRIKGRKVDRIEKEDLVFHKRVREGFLKIARENPERVVVIDGTKSIETIFQEILRVLKERKDGF
ncbi:MAG: dTMP kinase [Desulfurobacteriaceae bacterium]